MNYCTKCESYYQKPGSCNCYVPLPGMVVFPISPYVHESTAAPWCPQCGGSHVGPCPYRTTCSSVTA